LATQILGDYGADIIKVEPPTGDLMRANGVSKNRGMSSIFLAINRNKRSLSIDLKAPEGLEIIHRLLPSVDVVVHNMRVDAIERLGLGYGALSALKPNLVYCMATGFGESGPDAGKPAFDDVIQAASGIASLIGNENGKPDYAPTLLADKTCGLALANAVLAALLHRERTGQGQLVEVPMLETMVAFTMAEHLGGLSFEPAIGPAGYVRLLAGGRKPAPTRDGHVAMLPYTAAHWVAFFKGVGREDIAARYKLEDRHERNAQIRQIYADMASVTSQMSTDECLALCDRLDIPATRIYPIDELPQHPHLKAVGLFQSVDHPSEGPICSVRPSTLFERSPAQISIHAPLLGQHTDEMMREVGFDDEAIARLEAQGIINLGQAARP
jgi:formyl-CoA transferase